MVLLLALLALEARLEATNQGLVRLSYRLEVPDGASVLSFSALETSPIEALSATASGERLALSQESSRGRLSGTFVLPPGARSPFALEFHYHVRGARIPVVVLDVPPDEARSGAFTVRVELTERAEASVDFPSNGIRTSGALTWELPVLPAFLSWGRPLGVRREAEIPFAL